MVRLSPGLALLRLLKPRPGPINGGDSYSGSYGADTDFLRGQAPTADSWGLATAGGIEAFRGTRLARNTQKNSDQKPEFQGEL